MTQLGMQVVAFQAMMEMMAQQFPGAFSGYNLAVTESHQRTKADTSGTAKAVVASLQKLGLDFSEVTWYLACACMSPTFCDSSQAWSPKLRRSLT